MAEMAVAAPLLSVIMPIFNAARYLPETLDSVLHQSLQRIEIILVDDGSTDDSLAIMRRCAAGDSRVRIIEQLNSGAGVARNTGLAVASGEYLSFLDADDLFDHDMLRLAYEHAASMQADVVIFRCVDFSDKTGRLSINHNCNPSDFPKQQPFRFAEVVGNPFHILGFTWDKLFRRDFVLQHGFQFQALPNANDALFTYSALLQAGRIGFLNRSLVRRRLETGANISQNVDSAWKAEWEYQSALKAYLEQEGLWATYRDNFLNVYAGHWVNRFAHLKTPEAAAAMFDFTLVSWLPQMPVLELTASQIQLQHAGAISTLRRMSQFEPGQYEPFAAASPNLTPSARVFALLARCWRWAWSVRLWCADKIRLLVARKPKKRSTQ